MAHLNTQNNTLAKAVCPSNLGEEPVLGELLLNSISFRNIRGLHSNLAPPKFTPINVNFSGKHKETMFLAVERFLLNAHTTKT